MVSAVVRPVIEMRRRALVDVRTGSTDDGGRRITFSRLVVSTTRVLVYDFRDAAQLYCTCHQIKSERARCYFTPNGRPGRRRLRPILPRSNRRNALVPSITAVPVSQTVQSGEQRARWLKRLSLLTSVADNYLRRIIYYVLMSAASESRL